MRRVTRWLFAFYHRIPLLAILVAYSVRGAAMYTIEVERIPKLIPKLWATLYIVAALLAGRAAFTGRKPDRMIVAAAAVTLEFAWAWVTTIELGVFEAARLAADHTLIGVLAAYFLTVETWDRATANRSG